MPANDVTTMADAPIGDARNGALWIDPACRPLFERNGLTGIADWFAIPGAQRYDKPFLPGWRERLAVDLADETGANRRFFVKRFHAPPAREQRRRVLSGHARRTTAGVERHWLAALTADGIAVPQVAAFGEERSGWRERRSVLVLADVGGVSLEKWAATRTTPAPRGLLHATADLVGRFHRAGYVHRDLYLAHVFLVDDEPEGWALALIDLQRVMRRPWRRRRWQTRDLAQLAYSTPQVVAGPRARLRFLKRYLEGRRLNTPAVRRLIGRVERKAAQIAAHDDRRRRRAAALRKTPG